MGEKGVRPLVVCDPEGRTIGLLEENEKGFRKTIEQGHLWALHPGTGRLLPFHETIRVSIAEREGWYEAVLSETPRAVRAAGDEARVGGPSSATDSTPGASAGDDGDADARASGIGEVLEGLARLIASRHAELPEGSYTTHLFTSGPEKIRKKTGEEAVELILASTRETLVSESADLVYHLLVLLESEGVGLAELAAELDRR